MKKFLALAMAAALSVGLFACSSTPASSTPSNASSQPSQTTKLIYGTSADYPPFEFHILDNGEDKVVGLDVSLARQIAADMGVELEIAEMNFDNLLTLMAQGNCDFVIAAMESSPERLENASCSDPYYTDLPAMIVVKKENLDQYQSMDDFSGKTVGAQTGTTKADIVTGEMTGSLPALMTSVVDLVNNLVYDKCDALVLDGAVAQQYVKSNDQLAIVEAVPLGEALPYCVWVAKDDPKGLLPAINETIAKVLSDGSMDQFVEEANTLSDQALEG